MEDEGKPEMPCASYSTYGAPRQATQHVCRMDIQPRQWWTLAMPVCERVARCKTQVRIFERPCYSVTEEERDYFHLLHRVTTPCTVCHVSTQTYSSFLALASLKRTFMFLSWATE